MQVRDGSFFGRRKGKTLRPQQRETLNSRLPGLLLDVTQPVPADLSALFRVPVDAVRLEIGFGGGEHLLHEARTSPATGHIGIEPFENGIAKAVVVIAREAIQNVRLFDREATILLDWLPSDSMERIDLFYPDPWPKTRHWKRRFVSPENLARLVRCLQPGGLFRFASDVEGYVKWTLREAGRNERLSWTADSLEECRQPWLGWPGTRYEEKALAAGRRPAYLAFRKRPV